MSQADTSGVMVRFIVCIWYRGSIRKLFLTQRCQHACIFLFHSCFTLKIQCTVLAVRNYGLAVIEIMGGPLAQEHPK